RGSGLRLRYRLLRRSRRDLRVNYGAAPIPCGANKRRSDGDHSEEKKNAKGVASEQQKPVPPPVWILEAVAKAGDLFRERQILFARRRWRMRPRDAASIEKDPG